MAFTFSDLKAEVKRRATKNQGGSQFDTGIANVINTSLWRVAREAKWRTLRRTSTFNTVAAYSTGSGAVTLTANSSSVAVSGGTLISAGVQVGRYVKFSGSSKYYKVSTIATNTAFTLDQVWDGSSTTTATYSILGQEEYTLPIQVGHDVFLWHRAYGYPMQMKYIPTQDFYGSGTIDILQNVPLAYRMWGADTTLQKVPGQSTVTVSSSSSADTSISVTVFGTVNGYPDYEIITTNGTSSVAGSKLFSSIDRVTKNQSTTGYISVFSTTTNYLIAALPVGITTSGPMYAKIQIYPLPTTVFPINVFYYKMPFQLVNDGDIHELGEQFSEAIILLSVAKLKAEQNMKEDADFFKLYEDEIKSLKTNNVDKIDWIPKLKKPNGDFNDAYTGGLRYNQVGSGGNFGPSIHY